MTTASVFTRIERGIALLDNFVPDWRERVSMETLDMWSQRYCIVGQVFQGVPLLKGELTPFHAGLKTLGIDINSDQAGAHGFDAEDEFYEELAEAWREVLSD